MKKKIKSSQHQGLLLLVLLLLLGWTTAHAIFLQRDLGINSAADRVFVQVKGDVKRPGVYAFPQSPNLKELAEKAGGLCVPCKMPEKIRFESGTCVDIYSENGRLKFYTGPLSTPYKVTLKIPISINKASGSDLECLPGIGRGLAGKIVNYRLNHGAFRETRQIMNVPGVGKVRYSMIKLYIKT